MLALTIDVCKCDADGQKLHGKLAGQLGKLLVQLGKLLVCCFTILKLLYEYDVIVCELFRLTD